MQSEAMRLVSVVLTVVGFVTVVGCGASTTEATTSPVRGPTAVEPASQGLDDVMWMLGSWGTSEDGSTTEEHWSRLHDAVFVGWNRTVRGGTTVAEEHILITSDDDGIHYRVWPHEQAPTIFRLGAVDGERATFENPEHDFPQRIIYSRAEGAPSTLSARVEGTNDGEPTAFELSWSALAREQEAEGTMTERTLSRTVIVDGSPEEVWRLWTSVEGVQSFFAPRARVEPRPGGAFEMYFDEDAPEGQRGSEGCTFVELVPHDRIVFTWNFPPSLPTIRDAHTLVTLELSAIEQGGTEVTLSQRGWREGEDWDQGFAYFRQAWGVVFQRLQERLSRQSGAE